MNQLQDIIREHASAFETFFMQTEAVIVFMLDHNLNITLHNKGFATLVAGGNDVTGSLLNTYLLPESHHILPLPEDSEHLNTRLNFQSKTSSAAALQCDIYQNSDGGYLILGGNLTLTNDKILQKMTTLSNEMANMTRDLHKKNRDLIEANEKIKVLSGIVPICMHCKEIRDDKGYWTQLEKFMLEHSNVVFSHALCDKCEAKYYPDEDDAEA